MELRDARDAQRKQDLYELRAAKLGISHTVRTRTQLGDDSDTLCLLPFKWIMDPCWDLLRLVIVAAAGLSERL